MASLLRLIVTTLGRYLGIPDLGVPRGGSEHHERMGEIYRFTLYTAAPLRLPVIHRAYFFGNDLHLNVHPTCGRASALHKFAFKKTFRIRICGYSMCTLVYLSLPYSTTSRAGRSNLESFQGPHWANQPRTFTSDTIQALVTP